MKNEDERLEVKTMELKRRRKGETRSVIRKLNPTDPRDAELIQEHRDAIRHGHGIVFNVEETDHGKLVLTVDGEQKKEH